MSLRPPCFPARPVNGGPLPLAQRKHGQWDWDPKVNGWRAWLHLPTGSMFNRKNEPLSITAEFKPAVHTLRAVATEGNALIFESDWLDVEAFARRHNYGRGSLVILDAPLAGNLTQRRERIYETFTATGLAQSWPFLHEPPPENKILTFAYTFTDYGIAPPPECDWLADELHYRGEDLDGIYTGWRQMQAVNRELKAEIFEGLVAKRTDSVYPKQSRTPDAEFPFWMKHRWAF